MAVSRGLRFTGGFVAGFIATPLVIVALFLAIGAVLTGIANVRYGGGPPEISASFGSDGGAVTREGGASVVVTRPEREVTRQICRGTCDDLAFWHGAAERVEVRDASGRCILCRSQGFRLPFVGAKRWSLAGNPLRLIEERRK